VVEEERVMLVKDILYLLILEEMVELVHQPQCLVQYLKHQLLEHQDQILEDILLVVELVEEVIQEMLEQLVVEELVVEAEHLLQDLVQQTLVEVEEQTD
jgi:hypothetical protein